MKRAYARIDKGVVRLGNAWLERRWSAFLGTTTELRLGPGGEDCLARRSPEFHVDYGSRPLAAPDLGDVNWSESADAFGTAVVLELQGPGVALRLETYLFHRCPGMIRTLSITNTGVSAIPVTRAAADVLPLQPDRYSSRSIQGEAELSLVACGEPMYYVALRGTGDAFLLGACQKARFALFHPNPSYCAPVWEGSVPLAPGRTWQAPPVSLFWAADAATRDLTGALEEFHRRWENRDAATGAFHPSRN